MEKILNYIDGKLIEPTTGTYLDNIDPAIGEVYSYIPNSNKESTPKTHKTKKSSFGDIFTLFN